MQKLMDIVALRAEFVSATLEVNTLAVPRLLIFGEGGVLHTMSPPDQMSDLSAWLDGVHDGLAAE